MERSLLRPVAGGEVRVSRGAAYLFPQAPPSSSSPAAGSAAGLGSSADLPPGAPAPASPQVPRPAPPPPARLLHSSAFVRQLHARAPQPGPEGSV